MNRQLLFYLAFFFFENEFNSLKVCRNTNGQVLLFNFNRYFAHFFSPPSLPNIPKIVVFLIDVSGSMLGYKMEQVQEALSAALRGLDENVSRKQCFNITSYINKHKQQQQRFHEWCFFTEVGIPQFEAQSASCTTSARAEVAKRFNKLFLAIAQVALRFKENKSFLRFIALRTEKIYNSVRIIALRTEKNLVACALLRCAL